MKVFCIYIILCYCCFTVNAQRQIINFDSSWKFKLGDDTIYKQPAFNDGSWRKLDLPHDWSIEGNFNEKNSTTQAEGGLPAGIAWYRKTFILPQRSNNNVVCITFDGVYHNSEVWLNGHLLGKRPNGYVSFSYDLTSYLKYGNQSNVIAIRVDNSDQPNSRWYSGSGIYRNVWLSTFNKTHFIQWGTFITTPQITSSAAEIHFSTKIRLAIKNAVSLRTEVIDQKGKVLALNLSVVTVKKNADTAVIVRSLQLNHPKLWSPDRPYLYTVRFTLLNNGKIIDNYNDLIGVRSYVFDSKNGFSINGIPVKIKGVCMHHDLGALGAAINTSAIERQLRILKKMGCNAIRTSHNPPAPEFLDLCDKMGFLVMDEAFDIWAKKKSKHDYHENWAEWHDKDLQDQILRDRNHPSVFIWSIGNEIREQFDTTGISITRELVSIVKSLDDTRPVTSALSEADPHKNFIYKSGALDLVGLNYHTEVYSKFLEDYPEQKFIATETTSALETRGFYDKPTDSVRHWPQSAKSPFKGNVECSVSAYDNVAAYWGATHEETWKIVKKYNFLSGLFVWTGFDYIGEPTPYPWPARSSYFGIIDLAGFPKDIYYMYQSEWTKQPVLYILPHWNWTPGQLIDVWVYYSNADKVELFLNGHSLGIKSKSNDDIHVKWKVKFEPGELKAVSLKNGKPVLLQKIYTAGAAKRIILSADKLHLKADGKDLSFITVTVVDSKGNIVPDADNNIAFNLRGAGDIAGVDNGSQSSMEPFKAKMRRAFHGKCLVILQAQHKSGPLILTATSGNLTPAYLQLNSTNR